MSLKRIFLKDSFVYGVSSYLSLIAAFILTPIYTRILTKEDYGIMDLNTTWNGFFALIIPLGLATAVLRMYHEFKSNTLEKKEYLGTLLITLLLSSFLYVGILFLFSGNIISGYYQTDFDVRIYYLSIGIVFFTVITSYFQALNRIRFRKYIYLIINLVSFLLLTALGYILVVIHHYGILGFFIASFVASGVGFIMSVLFGKADIHFKFNYGILKSSLSYSIPLLMVIVFLKFTFIVDRLIINEMLDLKSIGEYSIIMRIGNVFNLLIGAFTTAWFPYAMSIISSKQRDAIYAKGFKYYLLIFSVVAFIIMLFNQELILFFAPDYLDIENVVYIIIPTSLVGGAAYFFGLGIHISKKTSYFLYSSVISFVINVLVSILLTYYLGIMGIALGSLIAIFSWVIIEYYFSYKLEEIKFNLLMLLTSVLVLLAAGFLISKFNLLFSDIYIGVMMKILAMFVLIGLMLLNTKLRVVIIENIKKHIVKW